MPTNLPELEQYLCRREVSLGMRISSLIRSSLTNEQFVSLGEKVLGSATIAEKEINAASVRRLNRAIDARRQHLTTKASN